VDGGVGSGTSAVDGALVVTVVVLGFGAIVVVGGELVGGGGTGVGVVGGVSGDGGTALAATGGAAAPLSSLVHPLTRMIRATIAGAR
jgi:hypothetical protein